MAILNVYDRGVLTLHFAGLDPQSRRFHLEIGFFARRPGVCQPGRRAGGMTLSAAQAERKETRVKVLNHDSLQLIDRVIFRSAPEWY